jgi:hypothetical protein
MAARIRQPGQKRKERAVRKKNSQNRTARAGHPE